MNLWLQKYIAFPYVFRSGFGRGWGLGGLGTEQRKYAKNFLGSLPAGQSNKDFIVYIGSQEVP